jgi:hypothetical protein
MVQVARGSTPPLVNALGGAQSERGHHDLELFST